MNKNIIKIFEFLKGTFKDKLQNPSGREVTVFILMLIVITSWIAEQFFGKHIPQFMFFGFISLIAAGLGLYTFESPLTPKENCNDFNTDNDVK